MSQNGKVVLEISNPTFDEVDPSNELAVVPIDTPSTNAAIVPLGDDANSEQVATSNGSSTPVIAHAVAQQEMQREMVAINAKQLQAENNAAKVTVREAEKLTVQQKVREQHEIVVTEKAVILQKRTIVETVALREFCQETLLEYKQQPQLAIEGGTDPDQDPEVIPTTFEKSIDICCQSCTCNFQNPFRRQKEKPFVEKKMLMTPTLRRSRAKG